MNRDELIRKWHLESLPCGTPAIGDGWCNLVNRALTDLVALGVRVPDDVAQIKEKFGALRLSLDHWPRQSPAVNVVIDEAERESAEVCEQCGAPAETRSLNGWLHTLCDSCATRRGT